MKTSVPESMESLAMIGTEVSDGTPMPEFPPPPSNIGETGIPFAFVVELACKTLHRGGVMSVAAISDSLALPVSVTIDALEFMKRERLAETKKGGDIRSASTYALTDLGRERARDYLESSGYCGAVPVTLKQYADTVRRQTIRRMPVTPEAMRDAFRDAVLPPGLLDRLGPAVNSGRSVFLYGPSGTGKTFMAEHLAQVLHGSVLIPHAVCVDNRVIRVFDPATHRRVEGEGGTEGPRNILEARPPHDRRYVACARPVVVAGGELTLAMLDLSHDAVGKFYEAPLQMKANNGVFLIDDLGRQLVRPFDLLNRWIVPLEKGRDYLSLRNGKKFEIPFDELILFSTNIAPRELADEAFLRRIGYKVKIDDLEESEYREIWRQECEKAGVTLGSQDIRHLVDVEHRGRNVALRACYPRDILSRVLEICRYEGVPPRVDVGLIRRACRDYFTEL